MFKKVSLILYQCPTHALKLSLFVCLIFKGIHWNQNAFLHIINCYLNVIWNYPASLCHLLPCCHLQRNTCFLSFFNTLFETLDHSFLQMILLLSFHNNKKHPNFSQCSTYMAGVCSKIFERKGSGARRTRLGPGSVIYKMQLFDFRDFT